MSQTCVIHCSEALKKRIKTSIKEIYEDAHPETRGLPKKYSFLIEKMADYYEGK